MLYNTRQYLTIKKAARFLSVTPQTLRNWDQSGKLKSYRNPINNYRLYKIEDLNLLLRKIESRKKLIFG